MERLTPLPPQPALLAHMAEGQGDGGERQQSDDGWMDAAAGRKCAAAGGGLTDRGRTQEDGSVTFAVEVT